MSNSVCIFSIIINHSRARYPHVTLYPPCGCHELQQQFVFSPNKWLGDGSAPPPGWNEKSSRLTNCSECSSLGVTAQTEEKQVAVITVYRLNRGLKYKWSSALGCWKELLYQDPLLGDECFKVGSRTEIDLSTSSSGWLEVLFQFHSAH